MSSRPAAGGGRWVDVDPERLPRWIGGFATRHGAPKVDGADFGIVLRTPDGAVAEVHAPPGVTWPDALDGVDALDAFLAAAARPRRLGLLLARKGAAAIGVADGDKLVASKVDTSYVQSRTAAGGWSQQRFARRRENQARAAAGDAADIAARILLPEAGTLAALVCGGDRRTVDAILSDRRLAPLAALRAERHLQVPDPRHAVLVDAIKAARAVEIHLPPEPPTS